MERKDWEHIILKTIIFLSVAVLIIMHFDLAIQGIGTLISFMTPMLLGFGIAFVINIIMNRLEQVYFPHTKNRFLNLSRRPVCIALSLIIILAAIAFVIIMVIPELIDACTLIAREIQESYEPALNTIAEWISRIPPLESWLSQNFELNLTNPADMKWDKFFEKLIAMIFGTDSSVKLGTIMNSTINIASNIGSALVTFAIALVFGIYALASKEKLYHQVKQLVYAYIKPKSADKIYHICGVANETFSNFIVGQCVEAVILGILCIIGMSIFRFPYAVMIGTLVGATALIPIIGAYVGAIVGAFMVLTQGGPLQMLLFIIFIIVLQQLEGNLIYPKVVGSSVGLPGIWVLAAVTIGASINGIFGMLIGVPLAATIYRLLSEDSQKRIQKRKKHYQLPAIFYQSRQNGASDTAEKTKAAAPTDTEGEPEDNTGTLDTDTSTPSEDSHLDSINQAFDEIVVSLDFNDEDTKQDEQQ